jgi:hypothetical protein
MPPSAMATLQNAKRRAKSALVASEVGREPAGWRVQATTHRIWLYRRGGVRMRLARRRPRSRRGVLNWRAEGSS